MVAWTEYKEHARARGSLALELFVVVSTPAKPPKEIQAVLPDHLSYLQKQESTGNLAFAGPLSDMSGDNMMGEGMIIYRAVSLETARQFAENDPMHQTGTRTFTIRRWLLNEGCLKPDNSEE